MAAVRYTRACMVHCITQSLTRGDPACHSIAPRTCHSIAGASTRADAPGDKTIIVETGRIMYNVLHTHYFLLKFVKIFRYRYIPLFIGATTSLQSTEKSFLVVCVCTQCSLVNCIIMHRGTKRCPPRAAMTRTARTQRYPVEPWG